MNKQCSQKPTIMITANEVLKECSKIFKEVLENEGIHLTNETTAEDIEEWDSLTHIELIVAVEHHFGIKFTSTEITSFKNVGDLCNTVQKKLQLKTA
jgi:acyl carrier protein